MRYGSSRLLSRGGLRQGCREGAAGWDGCNEGSPEGLLLARSRTALRYGGYKAPEAGRGAGLSAVTPASSVSDVGHRDDYATGLACIRASPRVAEAYKRFLAHNEQHP
jgi:hypothetical protein